MGDCLHCTWCGKSERDVRAVVCGPTAHNIICDGCAEVVLYAFREKGVDLHDESAFDITPHRYLKAGQATEGGD